MRLMALDLETTGVDLKKHDIAEIGFSVFDHETARPLLMYSCFILEAAKSWNSKLESLHHIHQSWVLAFGRPILDVIKFIDGVLDKYDVTAIVAHNGKKFDKPFLEKYGPESKLVKMKWIDTKRDLPGYHSSTVLSHLAADKGFLNPFPHSALMDSVTTFNVLKHYPIEEVMEDSLLIQANANFHTRELAKERGYSWDGKVWSKRIKLSKIEQEKREAPFEVFLA